MVSTESIPGAARLRVRLLLIGLPVSGGAGLAVHILSGISLILAIVALMSAAGAAWIIVLPRLSRTARKSIGLLCRFGAIGGLVATAAYDIFRYGIVALLSLSFDPFHVFGLFGQAILGNGYSAAMTYAVGYLYHVSNGTFFGVAYALVFRKPTWWTGALWGIGLELCMATLYPAWLRIQMFQEFLEVSALGHIVYGSVLGLTVARAVRMTDTQADVQRNAS